MLYLCLAMVLDVALFAMGLTMSIIDVNKYNFGLYLVLMSVVTFSLLVALWVAKPKFCRTPPWAIQVYHCAVKSSRPDYRSSVGETETLMEHRNTDELMRSIKGIPMLIQAIQYSLEAAYVPARDSTTAGPTITADSAIESTATTHDFYTNAGETTASDHSQLSNSLNGHIENHDSKKNSVRWQSNNKGSEKEKAKEKRHSSTPRRVRVCDMKRQSIFVVFPYSETVPFDQSQLRVRRSSSEHDLGGALHKKRKSSFERFCAAAIAGQNRCNSSILIESEHKLETNDRCRSFAYEQTIEDEECRHSSPRLDSVKKSDVRRTSIEVRYVGLQNILLAKMTAKQQHSNN